MRAAICRPLCIKDLAARCSVAERTLNAHFRAFVGLSPMHYLRRLRLAAAREALLSGAPGTTVTEVAKRYCFNHFGRFADQYRGCFGESPSATLQSGRAIAAGGDARADGEASPGLRAALPTREKPTIAVLPCLTSADEPALRWFAESVADALAAALSAIRTLAVTVPASTRASYRDPRRLAREFKTRYVLSGRLQSAGTRLRCILCVADATTGHHVWGDCFDGEPAHPLALQDRIVMGVVRAVLPSIRGAEIERAQRTPARSLDAHGLAMRALPFVFASRPDAARRALELLHRAIEIDPDYGLATALAAWCHGQLVMYNGTPTPAEDTSQALELVRRAAILDEDDPLALAARCAVHTMVRQFDVAEALVTRALAQDPFNGWAWGRSGWLHSYRGNSHTAIAHFRHALSLDVRGAARANSFIGIGSAHFDRGRYAAAARCLRRGLLEHPGMAWANRSLSVSYARLGDRLKALEALDVLRRFCPDLTVTRVLAAVPFRPDFLDRLGNGLSDLGLPP